MNVVAENHADSLRGLGDPFRDGLIAAVIGEGLRDNLRQEREELPEPLRVLLRSLEDTGSDRGATELRT